MRQCLTDIIIRHYYYYFVKVNGVKYLRETLGISEEVIPITHKKVKKNYTGREEGEGKYLYILNNLI